MSGRRGELGSKVWSVGLLPATEAVARLRLGVVQAGGFLLRFR